MTERRPPAAHAARPRSRRPPPGSDRSFLWRWRRGLFVVGLIGVAGTGGASAVVFNIELPPERSLLQTSFVCAAEVTEACGPDNAIATFSDDEDRINVRLAEVPSVLQQAVLATEDQDFYEHRGVDPVGISRALYNNVRGRGVRQGGSTITQQYVKNAYLDSDRSVVDKVKEAVLAVKLERELDKDEILERYLNTIYFGRGAYGVAAASRAYFDKDVRQIGLPEASYLAGVIRAPDGADPLEDPEEAARRRRTALASMAAEGYITAAEQAAVDAAPIDAGVIEPKRDRRGRGPVAGADIGTEYFVEAVRQQIADRYGEDTLYGGGLRIYTTIDFDLQRAAWDAVTTTLDEEGDPAAAVVAVDENGHVKAMVGGRDFQTSEVNLALGKGVEIDGTVVPGGGSGRQPGSAFKPFVLAEALRQDISLNSTYRAPGRMTFPGVPGAEVGTDWEVSNYGGTAQGRLDLVDATRESSNTAYAQLMLDVGPQNVVNLVDRLGVSAELKPLPSLVLGSGEVAPLDMAVGFSTFANRGVRNDPIMVAKIEQVDDEGDVEVIDEAVPTGERVLTEAQADQVTYCLQEVVEDGTGTAADFGKPVAGKTGTAQDNKDAWFVGYTPSLTAAVWMGYPDKLPDGSLPTMNADSAVSQNHGLRGVTGGSLPAEIWNRFMEVATEGVDTGDFPEPDTFPGRVLRDGDQAPPTTARPRSRSTTTTTESATTTTTAPPETTTTVAPSTTAPPPTTLPPSPPTTPPPAN